MYIQNVIHLHYQIQTLQKSQKKNKFLISPTTQNPQYITISLQIIILLQNKFINQQTKYRQNMKKPRILCHTNKFKLIGRQQKGRLRLQLDILQPTPKKKFTTTKSFTKLVVLGNSQIKSQFQQIPPLMEHLSDSNNVEVDQQTGTISIFKNLPGSLLREKIGKIKLKKPQESDMQYINPFKNQDQHFQVEKETQIQAVLTQQCYNSSEQIYHQVPKISSGKQSPEYPKNGDQQQLKDENNNTDSRLQYLISQQKSQKKIMREMHRLLQLMKNQIRTLKQRLQERQALIDQLVTNMIDVKNKLIVHSKQTSINFQQLKIKINSLENNNNNNIVVYNWFDGINYSKQNVSQCNNQFKNQCYGRVNIIGEHPLGKFSIIRFKIIRVENYVVFGVVSKEADNKMDKDKEEGSKRIHQNFMKVIGRKEGENYKMFAKLGENEIIIQKQHIVEVSINTEIGQGKWQIQQQHSFSNIFPCQRLKDNLITWVPFIGLNSIDDSIQLLPKL